MSIETRPVLGGLAESHSPTDDTRLNAVDPGSCFGARRFRLRYALRGAGSPHAELFQ